MKKLITVTLQYMFEADDCEELDDTLQDYRDVDFDNIDRPLNKMEDVGWEVISSKVEAYDIR